MSWKWMSDDTHDVLCPLFTCHWCAFGFNTYFDKYRFRFGPSAKFVEYTLFFRFPFEFISYSNVSYTYLPVMFNCLI